MPLPIQIFPALNLKLVGRMSSLAKLGMQIAVVSSVELMKIRIARNRI